VNQKHMPRHLEMPGNAACLQYTGMSGDEKLMKMYERITAEGPTLPCLCCCKQFRRSDFSCSFLRHIKATKNIACLNVGRKSTDLVVLKIYNKALQQV